MTYHLSKAHPEVLSSAAPKQPTIQQAFHRPQNTTLTTSRSSAITNGIINYIIKDLRPLSTVEGEGFRELMAIVEPSYTVPSRNYITNSALPALYNEAVGSLKQELGSISSCAITHDMWTSLNTEGYSTTTAHYINNSWVLRSVVLETAKFESQHTSDNIAKHLEKTRENWGLPVPISVTDNAANETKAFEILKWPHIPCIGHNLNLAVKAGLEVREIAKLISKGRRVVSFYHKSPLATSILQEKQMALLEKSAQGHKLITDVPTRWNSTLDMLERLQEQTPALHAAQLHPPIKKKTR